MIRLKKINEKLNNLINVEGPILQVKKDDNNNYYAIAKTNGCRDLIFRVDPFALELYLRSRITLKELVLLRQDEHYILRQRSGNYMARFLEITSEEEPKELREIVYGDSLYHLLPSGVRQEQGYQDLLSPLRPVPAMSGEKRIGDPSVIVRSDSALNIFIGKNTPLKIVSIDSEEYNEDEHDLLACETGDGSAILMTKINPMSLLLFLTGRITVKDVMMLRMDDLYFLKKNNGVFVSGFSDEVNKLLDVLVFGDRTYFRLPAEMQVPSPVTLWRGYMGLFSMNGKGIRPSGFKAEYPVDMSISI